MVGYVHHMVYKSSFLCWVRPSYGIRIGIFMVGYCKADDENEEAGRPAPLNKVPSA